MTWPRRLKARINVFRADILTDAGHAVHTTIRTGCEYKRVFRSCMAIVTAPGDFRSGDHRAFPGVEVPADTGVHTSLLFHRKYRSRIAVYWRDHRGYAQYKKRLLAIKFLGTLVAIAMMRSRSMTLKMPLELWTTLSASYFQAGKRT